MRTIIIYILNLLCIWISLFYILPSLFVDISQCSSKTYVLKEIQKDTFTTKKTFKEVQHINLVLVMEDNSEWDFTNRSSKQKTVLADSNNIGKTCKFYFAPGSYVPGQVEINDQLVYGIKDGMPEEYLILLFTVALTVYNLWPFFKKGKNKISNTLSKSGK
jgi:hypothetical protein